MKHSELFDFLRNLCNSSFSEFSHSHSTSRRLKKKTRSNKRTFYHWDHNTLLCQETYLNMLGIGRTYFENIRDHLINNGLLPRIHGNIKRMPQ